MFRFSKQEKKMKSITKGSLIFIGLILTLSFFIGCTTEEKKTIIFADPGWDSVQLHNEVAGFIAIHAYGYDSWQQITGTTPITHEGTIKGEIDVHLEEWTDNIASYTADRDAGKLKEMGVNFDDNMQGFYVPRYVIEGDASRGIEASAPNLKTVQDLALYPDVFQDPENKTKGRIYGSIPGWEIDTIMFNKYKYYGLDENFIYFRPGSDAALAAAFTSAIDKGQAIVGYYWEPTWLMGLYDLVLLEDAPYIDEESYMAGKTECPAVVCTTAVSNAFYEKDPAFCNEFVANYKTSSALISEALAYMSNNNASAAETALWLMKTYDNLLDLWLPEDKAALVRQAL